MKVTWILCSLALLIGAWGAMAQVVGICGPNDCVGGKESSTFYCNNINIPCMYVVIGIPIPTV